MLLPLFVLKQLRVSTSLKCNQPHPNMLLKLPIYLESMVDACTYYPFFRSTPQFLFFSSIIDTLGKCHIWCQLALLSSISLSSSTTKRISRFPCMHAGCAYD
jgi:hypothetical protein